MIRHWRQLVDRYPDTVLVGETPVQPVEALAAYYGTGQDELHLAFNFPFISSPLEAAAMRSIVEDTERALPAGAWPVWTGSNHDMSRLATRWAEGDPTRTRVAMVVLLCLRGTPVLYQGDEIGLPDTEVRREDLRDPLGVRYWPAYAGRDGMRTPMPWENVTGGGFTSPGVRPWLPFGDLAACNVSDQRSDPRSMLHLTRDLIALRRQEPELHAGDYRSLAAPDGVWAWGRGDRFVVVANLSDRDAVVDVPSGTVRLATVRTREGELVAGTVTVGGWEALVVQREA